MFVSEEPSDSITFPRHSPNRRCRFQLITETGLEVTKTYTFYEKLMLVDLEVLAQKHRHRRSRRNAFRCSCPTNCSMVLRSTGNPVMCASGPMLMINGKRDQPKSRKFLTRWIYPDPVQWVAYIESYFFAGMVPILDANRAFFEPTTFNQNNTKTLSGTLGLQGGSRTISSGEKVRRCGAIIVGPKKYEELKELNVGIENIIDFGWITWLGKAFYYILVSTVKFVKNYGLAIIHPHRRHQNHSLAAFADIHEIDEKNAGNSTASQRSPGAI